MECMGRINKNKQKSLGDKNVSNTYRSQDFQNGLILHIGKIVYSH